MAIRVKHIALSPSAIQLFLSCPQKFIFDKFRSWPERQIDPFNPSRTEWGTMMHEHLERHYRGEEFKPFYPSGGFSSKYFASVDARFLEYQKHYADEVRPEITAIEVTASREVTNVISLMGTADIVTTQGVWDHKTSGSINDSDFDKFSLSDQFTHYMWIAGRTSGQVTINQICSAPNPGLRSGDIGKKFARITFDVSEAQMNDWFERTKATAKEIVRTIESQDAWLKRRTGACGDFGGCFYASQCRNALYEPEGLISLTDDHFSITIET